MRALSVETGVPTTFLQVQPSRQCVLGRQCVTHLGSGGAGGGGDSFHPEMGKAGQFLLPFLTTKRKLWEIEK